MAILVEGRQDEEGIPGARQVQTAGYWVWAVGSVSAGPLSGMPRRIPLRTAFVRGTFDPAGGDEDEFAV
jgi:hypothetical protein